MKCAVAFQPWRPLQLFCQARHKRGVAAASRPSRFCTLPHPCPRSGLEAAASACGAAAGQPRSTAGGCGRSRYCCSSSSHPAWPPSPHCLLFIWQRSRRRQCCPAGSRRRRCPGTLGSCPQCLGPRKCPRPWPTAGEWRPGAGPGFGGRWIWPARHQFEHRGCARQRAGEAGGCCRCVCGFSEPFSVVAPTACRRAR